MTPAEIPVGSVVRTRGGASRVWPSALQGPEGVITLGLVLALASLPLADAGRSAGSWSIHALVFGVLVLAREAASLRSGAQPGVPVRRFLIPGALFLSVVLWSLVQSLPVSGAAGHPIWALAGETLGQDVEPRLTLDPDATRLAALRLVTLASAFWVAAQVAADPRRALIILACVVLVTVLASLYGFSTMAIGKPPLPGRPPVSLADRMAGTFGNRNAFATFAGMGLIVALALMVRGVQGAIDAAGGSGFHAVRASLLRLAGVGMLNLCAIVVIAAALVSTGSRGGILATAIAAAVLPFLLVGWRKKIDAARIAALLAIVFAALLLVLAVFGETALGRLSRLGLDDSGRLGVFSTTLLAIKASPWFGYGLGTFPLVFPIFRDDPSTIWNAWTSAHNVYLEIVLELGVPFALVLVLSVGSIAWTCGRGAIARRRFKAIPAAAACAAIMAFTHAAVDFSLSVQAVSLTLAIVLGVGFAQAFRSTRPMDVTARSSVPRPSIRSPATDQGAWR